MLFTAFVYHFWAIYGIKIFFLSKKKRDFFFFFLKFFWDLLRFFFLRLPVEGGQGSPMCRSGHMRVKGCRWKKKKCFLFFSKTFYNLFLWFWRRSESISSVFEHFGAMYKKNDKKKWPKSIFYDILWFFMFFWWNWCRTSVYECFWPLKMPSERL